MRSILLITLLVFFSINGICEENKDKFPLNVDCELEVKEVIGRVAIFSPIDFVGSTTNLKDLSTGDLSKFFTFKLPEGHEESKNEKEWNIPLTDKRKYTFSKVGELDGENPAETYILKHGEEYEVHITHWIPGDYRIYILSKNMGVVKAVMYLRTKKFVRK